MTHHHTDRSQRRIRRRAGFSLVELMVSLAIFLSILFTLFAVLSGGRRAWLTSEAQIDMNSEARRALRVMEQDLCEAAPGNAWVVNVGVNEDQMFFRLPQSFNAGTITWGDQIRYSLGGVNLDQLLRTNLDTGDVQVIGNYVRMIRFNRPTVDVVEITLGMERQSMSGEILRLTVSSQVALRNR